MSKTFNCPNCGAPVTTEICPYCNTKTGLDTKTADMEYPVIECKEATLTFWNTIFPMIFAISFGLSSPMFITLPWSSSREISGFFLAFLPGFLIFFTIGAVSLYITLKNVIRYLKIKKNGKEIQGIVYGYMDDNVLLNGSPAQIVKILIDTPKGKRFILYQLGDIKQPYKINSKIIIKVYKDIFMIPKDKEYYFE